jgi:hypothetical protein
MMAFSQRLGVGASGPNAFSSDDYYNATNNAISNLRFPSRAVPGVQINVGSESYSPLVGFGGIFGGDPARAKPTRATTPAGTVRETLESLSNQVLGQATFRLATAANPTGLVKAASSATLAVNSTARAAAASFDPFTLSAGSFSNYQYNVNVSLQRNTPGDFVGVSYYAVDSRFTSDPDGWLAKGLPLSDTLWSLSILSHGLLESKSPGKNKVVNFSHGVA